MWPAFSQACSRLREYCGNRRASAWSKRIPPRSLGTVLRMGATKLSFQSASSLPEKRPHPARSSVSTARSKLDRMSGKNYSVDEDADWEESFVAPTRSTAPSDLGGMRFDQALARLFPQ